ncbi:hypothetical protein GCM10025792_13700 [Pseudonocardia tropica]
MASAGSGPPAGPVNRQACGVSVVARPSSSRTIGTSSATATSAGSATSRRPRGVCTPTRVQRPGTGPDVAADAASPGPVAAGAGRTEVTGGSLADLPERPRRARGGCEYPAAPVTAVGVSGEP